MAGVPWAWATRFTSLRGLLWAKIATTALSPGVLEVYLQTVAPPGIGYCTGPPYALPSAASAWASVGHVTAVVAAGGAGVAAAGAGVAAAGAGVGAGGDVVADGTDVEGDVARALEPVVLDPQAAKTRLARHVTGKRTLRPMAPNHTIRFCT
jgi:hypothetical protein